MQINDMQMVVNRTDGHCRVNSENLSYIQTTASRSRSGIFLILSRESLSGNHKRSDELYKQV